ncbi:MAG: hypothetical protein DWQ04_07875 [Chloroflexi bacterium]|nr:MAG: hypothetical protein DWQ04_07875 [Chloroflexota bacterium]
MFLNPIKTAAGKLMAKVQGMGNGRSTHLLSYNTYTAEQRITTQAFIGKQSVSLEQIKGSMNNSRCNDFNAQFQLVNTHGRERLQNVAKAWRTKNLSPISLVQVGEIYFVQDGHHRVSIALSQKQELIEAHVTVVELTHISTPAWQTSPSQAA